MDLSIKFKNRTYFFQDVEQLKLTVDYYLELEQGYSDVQEWALFEEAYSYYRAIYKIREERIEWNIAHCSEF
jgi:hypothetical protein